MGPSHGCSVWRSHIFRKAWNEVVVLRAWCILSLAASVLDPALLWPCSFWGPEVSRQRWRVCRLRCSSSGWGLWQKSPWSQLCNGSFCRFSHRFPKVLAFLFDLLFSLLNLLAEVESTVVDFLFSFTKIVRNMWWSRVSCWIVRCPAGKPCGKGSRFWQKAEKSMFTFGLGVKPT